MDGGGERGMWRAIARIGIVVGIVAAVLGSIVATITILGMIHGGVRGGSASTPTATTTATRSPTPTPTPTATPTATPTPTPVPPQQQSAHYDEWTSDAGSPTFTDYTNAGGPGPRVPGNTKVEVSCRLTGFTVQDGNPWWYRLTTWGGNDTYYASADNYYNNGQKSGPLTNTPWYDPKVPDC